MNGCSRAEGATRPGASQAAPNLVWFPGRHHPLFTVSTVVAYGRGRLKVMWQVPWSLSCAWTRTGLPGQTCRRAGRGETRLSARGTQRTGPTSPRASPCA